MTIVMKKENKQKLFYKQEKQIMKNFIIEQCANQERIEAKFTSPWGSSHNNWSKTNKNLIKMLMQEATSQTEKACANRLVLQKGLENRNIQALYEDLGYLKDEELSLYAVNL